MLEQCLEMGSRVFQFGIFMVRGLIRLKLFGDQSLKLLERCLLELSAFVLWFHRQWGCVDVETQSNSERSHVVDDVSRAKHPTPGPST